MSIDVLCALEPPSLGRELKRRLRDSNVTLAGPDGKEIDRAIGERLPDLVVAGTNLLATPIEDWIRNIRALPESPEVVLIHDQEDPRFRAALLRAGCLAVLGAELPLEDLTETLQTLIRRRLEAVRLAVQARSPFGQTSLDDFVSESRTMQEFMALARKFVDADSSLLLLGETGTGKERLARAIHADGPRGGGPFVAVNCGGLPETLLESEFFGHEKGAFTGASHARRGYFEQADGGTLFLDEIGEVPQHLQVKLLRAIEQRQVQRLGGERSLPVDIRVVAATNRDLEQEVEAGRFRRDLYYRLAVVTLTLPPLRERAEDIPALFDGYVEHFRIALNRPVYGVQEAAREALVRYPWPGNVRELINVAERTTLLSAGPEIRITDLPRAISSLVTSPSTAVAPDGSKPAASPLLHQPLQEARREAVAEFEVAYLTLLLRATGGRINETARRAGITERSLYELMQRHRLRKEDFRGG